MPSIAPLLLACALALTFAAPGVSASHVVYEAYGPETAACSPLATCAVQIANHFIYSDPALDCTARGCYVFHECHGSVSGTQISYSWGCSDVGSGSGGFLAGGVPVGAAGSAFIPRDECKWLSFGVSATSLAVNEASVGHGWRVCVDATGPFVD